QQEDAAAVENEEWLRKVEAYQPRAHKGKGGIGTNVDGAAAAVIGSMVSQHPAESSGNRGHFVHGQTIDPEDSEPIVSNLVKIPEKVSQVVTRRLEEIKAATKIVDIKVRMYSHDLSPIEYRQRVRYRPRPRQVKGV
ncbi:hypothetical protein FOZ62_021134, partial [Perkinsus olseni]